jgi:hypothetical protein
MSKKYSESFFDFYIIRAKFNNNKPKCCESSYFKILTNENTYVPKRLLVLKKSEIFEKEDIKNGGFYKKYMKYKLKYIELKEKSLYSKYI